MQVFEHDSKANNNISAIYFRFDLSPVFVRFEQYRNHNFHFLVQLCAIVGGVFTVMGMFDSLINKCCGE